MDISTLRRQLRPTGQLKNGNKTSKGEDSETASVVSSEDSFSSQSTSDLSSNYSKGSRGDSDLEGFLERNPNGWWYCKVLDNGRPRKGWVPSNYLEKKH
uniref:SH3 domain-containing protein n=1 Tax=Periophthalmus magnuspinnatus TaxID=409849 RepID=A0A3B3ZVC7_9GOBI